MTIISYLAIYALGLVTAAIICLWVHRQHKKAWQLEYRRLMAGIDGALICLFKPTEKGYRLRAIKILQHTYNGD